MDSIAENQNLVCNELPRKAAPSQAYRSHYRQTLIYLLTFGLLFVSLVSCEPKKATPKAQTGPRAESPSLRVVSLSPALSATAEYLGAGSLLVGTSDYYSGQLKLPQLGSVFTPNLEEIVRVKPNLIVTTMVKGNPLAPLEAISRTQQYPWLTVEEIASSTELFGKRLGKADEAQLLATRFRQELLVAPKGDAPDVYLTWESQTDDSGHYFVKRNSAHGALLRAAGGKNAVARDIAGTPRLSTEELIRLNPYAIIVLRDAPPNQQKEEQALQRLSRLQGLDAVKSHRLKTLSTPGILNMGPALLNWIQPLRQVLLSSKKSDASRQRTQSEVRQP